MYMPTCVSVHHLCLWGLQSSEKGVGLEVWVVVSHQVVLRTKPAMSARATSDRKL